MTTNAKFYSISIGLFLILLIGLVVSYFSDNLVPTIVSALLDAILSRFN